MKKNKVKTLKLGSDKTEIEGFGISFCTKRKPKVSILFLQNSYHTCYYCHSQVQSFNSDNEIKFFFF